MELEVGNGTPGGRDGQGGLGLALASLHRVQDSGSAGRAAAGRVRLGAELGQTLIITPRVIYWTRGVVAPVLSSPHLFKLMLAGLCNTAEELPLTTHPNHSKQPTSSIGARGPGGQDVPSPAECSWHRAVADSKTGQPSLVLQRESHRHTSSPSSCPKHAKSAVSRVPCCWTVAPMALLGVILGLSHVPSTAPPTDFVTSFLHLKHLFSFLRPTKRRSFPKHQIKLHQ